MKNLAIDTGNTSVKYAIFENETMVYHNRIIGYTFLDIVKDINIYKPERSIVCTTRKLCDNQKEVLDSLANKIVYFNYTTDIPIKNLYKSPQTLGMDRLAAAIGAYKSVKENVLIIDIGTAITYDFVNKNGEYIGGNISAGMNMRFKALNEFTSQLPLINPEGNHPLFGEDTDSAIRCGVIDGIKYEIDGYIRKFSLKYPNLCVFYTGGDELYFENEIKKRIFADNFIVLKGLNEILLYQERQTNR